MKIYILLYLLITGIGLVVFAHGYSENRKKVFVFLSVVLTFIVQALRELSIGEDIFTYVSWFEDMYNLGWKATFNDLAYYVESGYKLLNLVVAMFSSNPYIFLGVCSLIILALQYYFIGYYSENVFLSILLYFGLNFFLTSMTTLRQFIAMGIIFWVCPLIENKKYFCSLVLCIVSYLFHHSSIVFALVAFCCIILNRNTKYIKLVLFAEVLVVIFINPMLKIFLYFVPKYSIYFFNGEEAKLGLLRLIYVLIDVVLIIYYLIRCKEIHTKRNNMIAIMVSVSALIGVLNAFIPHIFRLGYYFDFYLILFIPALIPFSYPRNRQLCQAVVVLGNTMLFLYYLSMNAGGTVPYETFLSNW